MKAILFLLLILFVQKSTIAQVTENDEISYVDSLGGVGTFENYKFLRVIKDLKIPNKEPYQVKEYYKSGKLAMSGSMIPALIPKYVGSLIYFYENGNKKKIEIYIEEGYLKTQYDFYENTQKKMVSEYLFNIKENKNEIKIIQFWDEKGVQKVIDGNGFLEVKEEGTYENGEIKNGFREGIWKGGNLKSTFEEKYVMGKLISGVSINEFSESISYTEVETMPITKKGMLDFYNFVGKNFSMPNVDGLYGKIIMQFKVDQNGKIAEPKIIQDLGYGTGEEAIRVLKRYGNWVPGKNRGRNVSFLFKLPISIQSSN